MELKDFVLENQKVIDLVKDRTGGNTQVDMYYGTLDYATARFNTILLKLSQEPLRADEHRQDIDECFGIIQSFYNDTKSYLTWPYVLKPIMAIKLHYTGKTQIPKIKFLLEKINN